MVTALITAALAAPTAPGGVDTTFVCEMRRGSAVARTTTAEEDARLLPEAWELSIGVPAEHGDNVPYDDPVLGRPSELLALWGYRRGDYWGSGRLIHSEYDHWIVEYTVVLGAAGEAVIWNRYFRTQMEQGRPRMIEAGAHGSCREIVSSRVRNPS